MTVYRSIVAVIKDLSKVGIAKDKTNTQGASYKFRGIDDVYNALAPLLATHGLCILPRVLNRTLVERQSKSGGALFYVTVEAEFDFVSAEDGTVHTVKTFGEAMDSGDKATNKAMSAAYKYACFQAFSIPTEGDHDADNKTYEVQSEIDSTIITEINATQNIKDLRDVYAKHYRSNESKPSVIKEIISAYNKRKTYLENAPTEDNQ